MVCVLVTLGSGIHIGQCYGVEKHSKILMEVMCYGRYVCTASAVSCDHVHGHLATVRAGVM